MNPTLEKYLTPISVLLAALIIGGALVFSDRAPRPSTAEVPAGPDSAALAAQLDAVAPVSTTDHIRGNPNAEVVIIEYSDTECPFCKVFHSTMQQVTAEYGDKVAWVYRHFPLDQLHQKARKEAAALECANELGGNDAFWKYTDRLFEITPSNDGLDSSELPKIASYVGLNVGAFNACLSSGKYDAHIEADYQNAAATGGRGTPWSIVVTKSGAKYPLSGAQPYEEVQKLIEEALKSN
jgi:protein-disulfide isomerase